LFTTVGAAMLGGLGMVVVWIWNLYRLMRGAFLLADRSPAP
jgi:flagellar biogenesis protein FliO